MTNQSARCETPVLLMLFNRPEITRELFKKLREARPAKLFIAANGPRPGVPADVELCAAVRAVFDDIDWECEVHKNFPETNVNMHVRWYTTLDWFFESVDGGIILEDDCIPDLSFFPYCTELLEKYKNEPKVMHVNGSNFQFGRKRGEPGASYYFSKYPHVWGWATWKRAWKAYDDSMASLPMFTERRLIDTAVTSDLEKKYWLRYFESIHAGIRNSCDIKWIYATWLNDGYAVTPNVNMISNIGYGLSAGHTLVKDKVMEQKTYDIGTLVHPAPVFARNVAADSYTFRSYFYKNLFQKAFYKVAMRIARIFS